MSDELKPCPFCGQPGSYYTELSTRPMAVCNNPLCDNTGFLHEIKCWQNRPIEDALIAERDAARDAIQTTLAIIDISDAATSSMYIERWNNAINKLRAALEPKS